MIFLAVRLSRELFAAASTIENEVIQTEIIMQSTYTMSDTVNMYVANWPHDRKRNISLT